MLSLLKRKKPKIQTNPQLTQGEISLDQLKYNVYLLTKATVLASVRSHHPEMEWGQCIKLVEEIMSTIDSLAYQTICGDHNDT